jgi:putative membrane protein
MRWIGILLVCVCCLVSVAARAHADGTLVEVAAPAVPAQPVRGVDSGGAVAPDLDPARAAAEDARRTEGGRAVGREMGAPGIAGVLAELHRVNELQIRLGRLAGAEDRGASPEVEALGARLVADHSAADSKVLALAKRKNLDEKQLRDSAEAAEMPAEANERLEDGERLRAATGEELDRLLVSAVVRDHRRTVAMVRDARDTSEDPQLNALLETLQPMLEQHLRAAEALAAGGTAPGRGQRPPPARQR